MRKWLLLLASLHYALFALPVFQLFQAKSRDRAVEWLTIYSKYTAMKDIIALIILAAACRQCLSFVPSRLSVPKVVTKHGVEREQNFRGILAKRKISTEENDDVSSNQQGLTSSIDAGKNPSDNAVPRQTLSGGTPLILDMARRMLVWDDELYMGLNDASTSSESSSSAADPTQAAAANAAAVAALPRWRPKSISQQSISNANPSFRTSSPIMTNAGYASILRRNSRKKNKPSMWRHCLRVYEKMGDLEKERRKTDKNGKKIKVKRSTAHHEAALVAASKLGLFEEALSIYQSVEKVSLASNNETDASSAADGAVMNLRSKKVRITDNMVLSVIKAAVKASRIKKTTTNTPYLDSSTTTEIVTEDNSKSNSTEGNATIYDENADDVPPIQPPTSARRTLRLLTTQERRKPLDFARDIVLSMEEKHDIPLVSRHVNPLASAYLHLGLRSEAANLINSLNDRRPPPDTYPQKSRKEKSELTSPNPRFSEGVQLVNWEDDDLDDGNDDEEFDNGYESPQLNIYDVQSKDRGSYALLVKGAVIDEDWQGAVAELQRMNDAGLHPNSSNLNCWSEVMEKGCRPAGKGEVMDDNYYSNRQRRRSWRKRRDGIWLGNLR